MSWSSWAAAGRRRWTVRAASVSSLRVQSVLLSTGPVPAARLPCRVKASAGKRYAWCACGHGTKQPFCVAPLRFTPGEDGAVVLCSCKQTPNAPYCDGSHFRDIVQDLVRSVRGVFK